MNIFQKADFCLNIYISDVTSRQLFIFVMFKKRLEKEKKDCKVIDM